MSKPLASILSCIALALLLLVAPGHAPHAAQSAIVDEARQLARESRTHVSFAAFLSSLDTRLHVIGAGCPGIKLEPLNNEDQLASQAGLYRNAAVAAQQAFEVVIEKAETWPESQLRTVLDRAKEELDKAESIRARIAPGLLSGVLGESSAATLGEVGTGRWSGFAPAAADTPDARN